MKAILVWDPLLSLLHGSPKIRNVAVTFAVELKGHSLLNRLRRQSKNFRSTGLASPIKIKGMASGIIRVAILTKIMAGEESQIGEATIKHFGETANCRSLLTIDMELHFETK